MPDVEEAERANAPPSPRDVDAPTTSGDVEGPVEAAPQSTEQHDSQQQQEPLAAEAEGSKTSASLQGQPSKETSYVLTLDDPDRVTVVYVRPGSEFHALMYLLRRISRRFHLDEVLPELPPGYEDHEFRILTWPKSEGGGRPILLML